MKTTFQFLGLDVHNSWYRMLEQHVDHWERLTAVTASEVVIERQHEGRAVFRVQVSLQGSGGDLQTVGNGRTLRAALIEATQDLECQILDRQTKRQERRASERRLSAAADPPTHE